MCKLDYCISFVESATKLKFVKRRRNGFSLDIRKNVPVLMIALPKDFILRSFYEIH